VQRPHLVTLVFVLAGLVGCKLGKVGTPDGASKTWAQMDHAERVDHMAKTVEPRLAAKFREWDAERYADFDCATCHGEGANDGTYAMPNPDLPHLEEKGLFKKHRKEQPEAVKFMWKVVEAEVADAMGLTYGPKGDIACWTCHVVDDRH